MKRFIQSLYFLCLLILVNSLNSQEIPKDYKLVYDQSFSTPQSQLDFEMTDPEAWNINNRNYNSVLELHQPSVYSPRVRSPLNIAMLNTFQLKDFILEVKLAQTGKEYGHRDLCLFFGMRDPSNFYYVHMATTADDHANNIFLVNDAPRRKIATKTSTGTKWGATDSWHTVRIIRNTDSGNIQVYFDNLDEAVMEATDTHFMEGYIGFGSFDDTGIFDDIKIWAPSISKAQKSFFHE